MPPSLLVVSRALSDMVTGYGSANDTSFVCQQSDAGSLLPVEGGPTIEVLREVLKAFTTGIELSIQHLNQQHNSKIPLHQFPVEIFARILYFALVLDHSSPLHHHQRLTQLRLVAKVWDDTVRISPILWSIIDVRSPGVVTEKCLAESKNVALYVRWKGEWLSTTDLLLADDTLRRWGAFYFSGSEFAFTMLKSYLEQASTPSLTELFLYSNGFNAAPSQQEQPILRLQDGGKTLRHVHLEGISAGFDSSRFKDLRSLQVSWQTMPPTVLQVVQVLQSSPQLESLILRRFYPHDLHPIDSKFDPTIDTTAIFLPCLQDIDLRDLPAVYYHGLVPRIKAPRCEKIMMGASAKGNRRDALKMEGRVWDPQTTQLGETLRKGLLSAKAVFIDWTDGQLILSAFTNQQREHSSTAIAWVEATHPESASHLSSLLTVLGRLPITASVRLKMTSLCHQEVPLDAIARIPTVETLAVYGGNAFRSIIKLLQDPLDDGSWPLPRLYKLQFHWCEEDPIGVDELVSITRLIQKRWGCSQSEAKEGVQKTAILTILVLYLAPNHRATWGEVINVCLSAVTEAHPEVDAQDLQYRCEILE